MEIDTLFASLKIKSNGYRVIKTGTVITHSKNGNIEFNLEDFTLKLRFEKNDDKKQSIEVENTPQNEISLICYNYNNPLGVGLQEPIHIASSNDKKIYFKFICGNMSNLPWINYTFYAEE